MNKKEFEANQWTRPENIDDAVKMIRKIKELFPIAGIIWLPEDVVEQAYQMDARELTKDEVVDVIDTLERTKDCTLGITWNTIEEAINQVIEDSEDDEPPLCSMCNGSGEGRYDGTTCMYCKGTGVEIRRD